jgi:hypothetical protein
MNEKEANKTINIYKQLFDRRAEIEMEPRYRAAQSYLEAIGKAKGLEEALEKVMGSEDFNHYCVRYVSIVTKALTKWEEEK